MNPNEKIYLINELEKIVRRLHVSYGHSEEMMRQIRKLIYEME